MHSTSKSWFLLSRNSFNVLNQSVLERVRLMLINKMKFANMSNVIPFNVFVVDEKWLSSSIIWSKVWRCHNGQKTITSTLPCEQHFLQFFLLFPYFFKSKSQFKVVAHKLPFSFSLQSDNDHLFIYCLFYTQCVVNVLFMLNLPNQILPSQEIKRSEKKTYCQSRKDEINCRWI